MIVLENLKKVDIFTDGACSGNPGAGGWGAIIRFKGHEKELSGGCHATTNNRMELTAVIEALKCLKEKCEVTVYSDSQYFVNAMTKGWAFSWKAKNWRRSGNEPVLNPDLWQELLDLWEKHEIQAIWVKGHAGHPENERCDALAVGEIKKLSESYGISKKNADKILIVVDMQNDFITGALGTKEAEKIVGAVKEKIEKFDGEVFFTRDTHFEDYLSTQEGKNLPVEHCIKGTQGWEIHPELDKIRKEFNSPVFDKITFGSQELAEKLCQLNKSSKINEIVLIGICTDICVISNALTIKTFLPEVNISVDSACCAGVTPESHENALNAMKMCQIKIL